MGKFQKILKLSTLFLALVFLLGSASSASAANFWSRKNKKNQQPPLVYLYATKYVIKAGKSTKLYWDAKRADTCVAASPSWSGSKDPKDKEKVSPTTDTIYTITCSNEAGSYTDSVEISVLGTPPTPPPATTTPPTVDLNADKTSIVVGATSTLSWTSTNASSCSASNGWSGSKSLSGNNIVSPGATTTYVLACSGVGGTATDTVVIAVSPALATTTPPAAPTLTFNGNPLAITDGATSTLTWSSANTNFCLASNGWSGSKSLSGSLIVSPVSTTTYTLACGGLGGTTTPQSVIIGVTASSTPLPPALDHLIISEVYYDVGDDKGAEPTNEWIEIYNGTGSTVDVSNWFITDTSGAVDIIPSSTTIPNGGFLVLTASSTTSGLWSSVPMLSLNSSLGNALGNAGDAVYLKNAASSTVDALSYGNNVTVFSPAVSTVAEGHSLRRTSITTDTNTAADWADNASPNPGS